ncbi:hypothetical protein Ddye_028084 [Dipteronia dyeriana]|uniref:Uncharacterized protein n=1 Tax=Dipteronia dyeriana TaxID=168575 RepID=A0AAD9WQU1_9ROSI|nr:hypothetical protein Ddye_028084 [Dipteronia dyeriana]
MVGSDYRCPPPATRDDGSSDVDCRIRSSAVTVQPSSLSFRSHLDPVINHRLDPTISLLLCRRSESFIADPVLNLLLRRRSESLIWFSNFFSVAVIWISCTANQSLTVTPALLLHRRRMDTLSPEKSGGAGFLRTILFRH